MSLLSRPHGPIDCKGIPNKAILRAEAAQLCGDQLLFHKFVPGGCGAASSLMVGAEVLDFSEPLDAFAWKPQQDKGEWCWSW